MILNFDLGTLREEVFGGKVPVLIWRDNSLYPDQNWNQKAL
jgi:hypothetical protein